MDFRGQKRAEDIYVSIIVAFSVLAFLVGFLQRQAPALLQPALADGACADASRCTLRASPHACSCSSATYGA